MKYPTGNAISPEVFGAPEQLQDHAPELRPVPTVFLRDERGGARTVAAALAFGLVGVAGIPVAGWLGGWRGTRVVQQVDEKESAINATHLLTDSIDMPCRSIDFYEAAGSNVKLPMTIKAKEIPESYAEFTVLKGSIAAVKACQDESKPSAITSNEAEIITTKSGNQIYTRIVEINTDNIVTTAQFPEGNLNIERRDGALLTAITGASQTGKVAITVACLPFKAGAKVGGKSLDCGAVASVATRYVNRVQTNGQITAEETVLKTIQQRGSEESWQQYMLPAFIDSLACKAVNEGGEEALEALRIKITGANPAPDFSKDMFDKYRGKVLSPKDDDIKVLPKVKINPSKPYVPKCYSNSITDPTTQLMELSK